jgi:hypothetical protein
MLTYWVELLAADDSFFAVAIFSLSGLDASLWAMSKGLFDHLPDIVLVMVM